MTVSYTRDIANGGKFVCFWRVLIRWKGSLYKLIWQDLLCYCVLFALINYIHMHALPTHMQLVLQKLKGYLSANVSMFPVPFVLSFFVDQVATKWWHQYQMVPSPDTLGIYTNAAIPGKDEKSRMVRRTIVRYAILSLVLTLRGISTRVKKRFPTIKHVQEAGLILEEEKIHYDRLDSQFTANNWLPLVWAANIANHARNINKVSSDQCLRLVVSELTAHRDKLGTLVGYDLVSIPLVYTQTMVVVVLSYLIITLFSYQPTIDENGYSFSGLTISSLTNFIIYVGLMKVATVMLNPFGEDDDDFELNATIDRHMKAAYMIVDEMHEEEPEVVKDAFWDEIVPKELPYTVGSAGFRKLDPHCVDNETQQTTTQAKSKISRIKSLKGMDWMRSFKETKRNRDNLYSKSMKKSSEDLNDRSIGFVNKAFDSSQDNIRVDDSEIYDFPDTTRPLSEVQRPSTSNQYPR